MDQAVYPLLCEFLAWISDRPRTDAEAMEAWRTSCPRQSVWEDALSADLIQFEGEDQRVTLSARGRAALVSR